MVRAHLVTDASRGRWSISCSEPWPQRETGDRPPRTSIGLSLAWAVAIAEIVLVTPGPAVTTATPQVRVSFDQPSAAKAAVCSWRTSKSGMPSSWAPK